MATAALGFSASGCVILLGDFEQGQGCEGGACGPFAWAKAFGSATGESRGTSVAIGPDGSVVVAGLFTDSLNLGGETLVSNGAHDYFVVKLDTNGNHVWSQSFGDLKDQAVPPVVLVTPEGDILLAGGLTGSVTFGGTAIVAPSLANNPFVVRLDGAGQHLWSHVYGADAGDTGSVTDVALDPGGDIVLTGVFRGVIDFGGPDGARLNLTSANDIFLGKLDAAGNGVFTGFEAGSDFDDANAAVAVASNGDIVIGGVVQGHILFDGFGGEIDSTSPAAFAARYDTDGVYQGCGFFAGTGEQVLVGLGIDGANDVVLAGHFKGSLTAAPQPALQTTDTTDDLFVVKLDPTLQSARWSRGIAEKGNTLPTAMDVTAAGAIALAGSMTGTIDLGSGPLELAAGATDAAFFATLAGDSSATFGRAAGGPGTLVSVAGLADDRAGSGRAFTGELVGSVDLGLGPLVATHGLIIGKLAP